MNFLEWFAAALGVVSVILTIRQNVWCWPIGIAMVTLYVGIFAQARLYADAGLQVIYIGLQIYGWYAWLHGGPKNDRLPVSVATAALLAVLGGAGALGTIALGYALTRWTDQALAYWDSAIAVYSLIAQWMLARKLLQNWLLWIAIDILAVGVYTAKDLHATAALYCVFVGLAVAGFRAWRRSLAVPETSSP
jgi:nicotinamide mononucleotide transporter